MSMITIRVLQGLSFHVVALLVFVAVRSFGHVEDEAPALSLVTLILSNLALALRNRNCSKNRTICQMLRSPYSALLWVLEGTITFVLLIVYLAFLRNLLSLPQPSPYRLAVVRWLAQ